jgi:hypothetical protein
MLMRITSGFHLLSLSLLEAAVCPQDEPTKLTSDKNGQFIYEKESLRKNYLKLDDQTIRPNNIASEISSNACLNLQISNSLYQQHEN